MVRDEKEFLKLCTSRAENNENKLKFMDVNSVEQEVEFKDAKTLANVMDTVKEKFPGLVTCRVPIAHGAAPKETDFDAILNTLIGSGFNTPVIVNDHIGDNRSTTGGIIACIFKEFQVSASYDGLVQSIPGVDMDVLKMDKYKVDKTKDPMVRGEFNVINDLMKSLEGSEYAKKECDKIVDVNGTPNTGGSGLVQIREEIAANKMNYELMEDAEQVVLKAKIMDNIQKYFYLIVFTVYMREAIDGSKDEVSEKNAVDATLRTGKHAINDNELVIKKNFVQFMQEKDNLRDLIEEGKGNLKWERDIPDLAWETLQDMATDDFDKNLGAIIKNIFSIAHSLFSDLMAGPDKKRATYRFASKTLLRLLPAYLLALGFGAAEVGAVATLARKARKAFGRHELMLRVHGAVHGQGGGARPIDPTGPKDRKSVV